MRRPITAAVAIVIAAVLVPAALAATATPFGGATVSGGVLRLVSNTGDGVATNDFSGASFSGTGVTTFSSIATLSTEFNVTDDDCIGGSPRFQVRVQTPQGEKNVFVYLGPTPSFTGCSQNVWIASGNLVGTADTRYDTSQVQGGKQVSNYADALALVGAYQVTGISLVVDSGWALADKEQTVDIRNVRVNTSTFYAPVGPKPPSGEGMSPGQACKKLRADMGLAAFRAAYGENHNGANAFGKCVSKMARMKNDTAREAAVERIGEAADRCTARETSGKGKGQGNGRAKGHAKQLQKCLKRSV
jgi:ABC-type cobalt transport system substrate-binding protein